MGFPSLIRRAFSSIKSRFARTRVRRGRHPPPPPPTTPAKNTFRPISSSEIAAEFSHHDPDVARINNGSFGCCPASVLSAQSAWQLLYLRQPDDFVLNHLHPSILRSRALLKHLINASHVNELSILDNVTTASAVVLHHLSWAFTEGDAVVVLQHAYPAVKKSLHAYISRAGGRVIEAPLPFPVTSNEEIVVGFRRAIALGKSDGRHRVRLAVIDHVTSMPSFVVPVRELTRICREEGVEQVFVDGAHAVGNVDIDVEDIGADYYASNLHKWLFCPPAAAFLYCRGNPDGLHHPVVSHEFGKGMAAESGWVGTRDYSAYLVVPSVMEFVDRFEGGIGGIQRRNHEKAVEMAEMLAESWGTGLGAPPDMCSSMAMVGLPGCLGISSDGEACELRKRLREEFKVEVHVLHHSSSNQASGGGGDGKVVTGYVRISHQVYNGVDDYHRLRDAINKLVQDRSKLGTTLHSS